MSIFHVILLLNVILTHLTCNFTMIICIVAGCSLLRTLNHLYYLIQFHMKIRRQIMIKLQPIYLQNFFNLLTLFIATLLVHPVPIICKNLTLFLNP